MAMTIGLTGGIGSGKSTVAKCFAQCGAEVVVGDELGRQAVETQKDIQIALRDRFGDQVFQSSGVLNRAKLGERVFSDPGHVQWLTALTFPFIHAAWIASVAACRAPMIVFDAALIFEWDIQNEFDRIVVVTASPELIAARAVSGRFSSQIIEQRLKSQIPIECKVQGADHIIDNSGSINDLENHVQALCAEWANQ
jgi:dephospho-CoA kinase